MSASKLNIIQGGDNEKQRGANPLLARQREAEAQFERLWMKDPQQFNPSGKPEEKARIERTLRMIEEQIPLEGISVVDIGAGFAPVAEALAKKGVSVLCTDIASGALKHIPDSPLIQKQQQGLPSTSLEDSRYDLCLALEVIAEVDRKDLRLAVAELCRVIKNDGHLILSSALDIYSEDALQRLLNLVETEFKVERITLSTFAWSIKLAKVAPLRPLLKIPFIANLLEKLCGFIAGERGISHAILLCKRRPLLEKREEPALPDRAPFRREIKWE